MNNGIGSFPRGLETLRAWLLPIGAGMDWWADEADIPGPQNGKRWFIVPVGQDITQAEYPRLYAKWCKNGVHKFGAGSVPNSTKAPDKRGRASFAKDDMGGSAASRVTSGQSGVAGNTLGAAGGDERLHAHAHGVSDPTHIHNEVTAQNVDGYAPHQSGPAPANGDVISGTQTNTSASGSGISIQNAGAGASQNMPPAIVCNYIIRAG